MDHSPFEGFLKTLAPIVIFIIWAMLSRPAQKKKKEQEELRRRRQQEIEASQTASPDTDRSSDRMQEPEVAKEDWKRSIEDVLEEMGLPVERKPAPPPMNQPAQEKTTLPSESPEEEQSLEDLEPEVAPEKAPDEKMKDHLAIQEHAYTLAASPIDNQKAYFTAAEYLAENASQPHTETGGKDDTAGELQKFIVWAELLGKPVALRDEGTRLL
jgi:hypothetical protein